MVFQSRVLGHLRHVIEHALHLGGTHSFSFHEVILLALFGHFGNRGVQLKAFPDDLYLVFLVKLSECRFKISFSDVTERAHYIAPYLYFHNLDGLIISCMHRTNNPRECSRYTESSFCMVSRVFSQKYILTTVNY